MDTMNDATVITLVSPEGNPEVWNAAEKAAKLEQGYKTYEAWLAEQEAAQRAEAEREAEKARAAHEAWLADPANRPELFRMLRQERDKRIADTDYMAMPDYPLDEARRAEILVYRQALRDLPSQDGAPWDGGGDATPWPVKPEFLK